MYTFTLAIHNILRWAAVALFIFALYRTYRGFFTNAVWTETDRKAGTFLTISLDLQLLLGLLLYFGFSQLTKQFLANPGEAMTVQQIRFFGMEHVFFMVIAIVLGHIGSAAGKKDIDDKQKFKRGMIFYSLSLLLVLAGIPWWRPLFPGL